MKAVIKEHKDNGKHHQGETTSYRAVAVIYKGDIRVPVSARWSMGRSNSASIVHCNFVVCSPSIYISGHGTAGGYGYHKASAALGGAIRSAGVELSENINGAGDRAIDDALIAVCRALGYRGKCRVIGI